MVTDEERQSFGWLGSIPKAVSNGPRHIVSAWKTLAKDARRVALMKDTHHKVAAAKKIEERYHAIVQEAERYGSDI